ncbi:hypothetical protein [Sorangium sp. So ce388]|uniref:hypothetical protein n=1 Tax=Sorangium sp. So ce388 TaxID=3133309 RepID=UPI003F5C0E57
MISKYERIDLDQVSPALMHPEELGPNDYLATMLARAFAMRGGALGRAYIRSMQERSPGQSSSSLTSLPQSSV